MTAAGKVLKKLKRRLAGVSRPVWNRVYPAWLAARETVERPWLRAKQARLVGKTIVITGSVGKSTTTMLIRRLLEDHVVVSTGGKNSGHPFVQQFREMKTRADFVVQELSAYPIWKFDNALRMVAVDIGVITRIGLDHAKAFRNVDTVAEVKGRLAEAVVESGVVCLNADDERCRAMAARAKARVILFGTAAEAEVRAEAVDATWPNRLSFDLVVDGVRRRVQTRLVGALLLPSVLAALAVARGLGLDLDKAISRLADVDPYPLRLEVVEYPGGHTYLLDTYKASYWSTLELIEDMKTWGHARRIFVLGDMSDIRNDTSRHYRRTMRALADSCDLVIGMGGHSESAARKVAAERPNVIPAGTIREAARILREQPPSLVVLKSNSTVSLNGLARKSRQSAARVS